MPSPYLNRKYAIYAICIGCAVSLLPLIFLLFAFLTFPGAIVASLLLGPMAAANLFWRIGLNMVAMPILIYSGLLIWAWVNNEEVPSSVRNLLIFWFVLLVPWMIFGPLSAMAFDAGPSAEAYLFFWSAITYPVTVILAAILCRRFPYLVLLPVLNFVACLGSSALHK